jgi:hypothetical protein
MVGTALPPGTGVNVRVAGIGVEVGGLWVGRGVGGTLSVGRLAGSETVGRKVAVADGSTVGVMVAVAVTIAAAVGGIAVLTAGEVRAVVARPSRPSVYSQEEKRNRVSTEPKATFLRSLCASNQAHRS